MIPLEKPLLIVVGGPTGSGKTAFSIRLAEVVGASVISADSRQVFGALRIGSAAPSEEERVRVPHYFVGTHEIEDPFNAGLFATQARQLLEEKLFPENRIQIVCGGSGLYLHALLHGMDNLPDVSAELRQELNNVFRQEGLQAIQEELERADPEYFNKVDRNNPQRILRALEVIRSTGKPYSSLLGRNTSHLPFRSLFLAMDLPREQLYAQINARTLRMIEEGWLAEAEALLPFRHINALQTVGYKELFEYFDGKRDLNASLELIMQNTRRFAKRQLTWLRNRETVNWLSPDTSSDKVFTLI